MYTSDISKSPTYLGYFMGSIIRVSNILCVYFGACNTGYTGCFTTCGHYCRKWFPRSLWSKKFI